VSNKKLFLLFLVPALFLFVGYGVWALTKSDDNDPQPTSSASNGAESQPDTQSQSNNAGNPTGSGEAKPLTKAEVSQHDSENDCWTIIDGNVYDLTSYIPRHPGGDEILRACGADGSTLFNTRSTDSGESVGSGTPHSSSAKSQLQSLFVGPLSE